MRRIAVGCNLGVIVWLAGLTTSAQAGLLVLYQFEDASGTVGAQIADGSGNDVHGMVISPSGFDLQFVPSQSGFGNAGAFGDAAVVTDLAPVTDGTIADFAFAFWMKADNTSQSQVYLLQRNTHPSSGQVAVIWEYVDDRVELYRGGGGGPDPRPGSQMPLDDTDWHHVVYTRIGDEYAYYKDGVKTVIGSLPGDITDISTVLAAGAVNTGDLGNFRGLMDDVAYFDIGLTQEQVTDVMGGDFSGFNEPVAPGDFDGDGDVDGADFVVWQTNFPTAEGATLDTGDADGDGDVDGADFVVWQTNFPFTPSPGVTPVPEPQSIVLSAIGVMLAVSACRRRNRR